MLSISLLLFDSSPHFCNAQQRVFVLKLNQNLSTAWSTYIGCTETDDGNGIAVDNAGSCFIVGSTTKGNYPKLNAWQTTIKLPSDAVVSKFSSNGNLVWSTFAGGFGTEDGQAIAVDNIGNILVTGYTLSTSYPLVNATQSVFGGQRDAFILRFTNNGTCLLSTYYEEVNASRQEPLLSIIMEVLM